MQGTLDPHFSLAPCDFVREQTYRNYSFPFLLGQHQPGIALIKFSVLGALQGAGILDSEECRNQCSSVTRLGLLPGALAG